MRLDRAVVTGSIEARQLDDGRTAILLTVKTDRLGEEPVNPILDREPVALVYPENGVGLHAPAVYSERDDFPRRLTHLNPVPDGHPASVCLAREGHPALYERFGIAGILVRLCNWFRDAKTGDLDKDDWEPVPFAGPTKLGVLDGSILQDLAAANTPEAGWAVSLARRNGEAIVHRSKQEFFYGPDAVQRFCKALAAEAPEATSIPILFAWQRADHTEIDPRFRPCEDRAALDALLSDLGLRDVLESARSDLSAAGVDVDADFVAVVGVRRPKPIVWDRHGLSADAEARKLDLRAYLVSTDPETAEVAVSEVQMIHPPDRKLLAAVSGRDPTLPITLLGYGALGSTIGAFLCRMGAGDVHIVDRQLLQTHNLARHSGTWVTIGKPKPISHTALELTVAPADEPASTFERSDITKLSPAELRAIGREGAFVVDATASDAVRRTLATHAPPGLITRVEIYHEGRLGVQSVEGDDRNPDLIDLYFLLCALGQEEGPVRDWLVDDARTRLGQLTSFASGFGCASATVRLPYWAVAAHATAFMSTVSRVVCGGDCGPGLGINATSPDFAPLGWRWIDIDAFRIERQRGWEVRIAPGVEDRMVRLSATAEPNETGGYLYGGVDARLRRIEIVAVASEPPGTVAGPTHLELPPALQSPEEQALVRNCGRRIEPVGSWHSHPGGRSRMSGKDVETADRFVQENRLRARPTLLMIVGADGISVNVVE